MCVGAQWVRSALVRGSPPRKKRKTLIKEKSQQMNQCALVRSSENQKSKTENQKSKIKNRKSKIKNQKIKIQKSRKIFYVYNGGSE